MNNIGRGMKKFWVIVTMLFAFTLMTSQAEAKKFGGGKSFGSLFKTAPSQPKKMSPGAAGSSQKAAPNGALAKGGMMKGLMGGLLAGGLIAALFGGAFEGIQFMDILLLGLVVFVVIRLMKSMAQAKAAAMQPQTAYAGSQFRQGPDADFSDRPMSTGFGEQSNALVSGDEVPFNLPEDFDLNSFLSGAREHYRTIQQSWNENNLDNIKEYVSDELFVNLSVERASLAGEQHTEVMFVDAELVRAEQIPGVAELSIKFNGRYRDTVEGVEEDITDIWHLQRDLAADNAPWLIVGIEV